eukprot:1011258_1
MLETETEYCYHRIAFSFDVVDKFGWECPSKHYHLNTITTHSIPEDNSISSTLTLQELEDINRQIQKCREDIAIEIAIETKNNHDSSIYLLTVVTNFKIVLNLHRIWKVHGIKDTCLHFKRIYSISQTDIGNIIIDINELKVLFHKQNGLRIHQLIYDISDAYHFSGLCNHRGGMIFIGLTIIFGLIEYILWPLENEKLLLT